MAPQKKSVSQLPLFSDWHAVSTKNTHIGATPVLTLRLRSLGGGTVYQVPLSIRAAKAMLLRSHLGNHSPIL